MQEQERRLTNQRFGNGQNDAQASLREPLIKSHADRVSTRTGWLLDAQRSISSRTTGKLRGDADGPLSSKPGGTGSLRAVCFVATLVKGMTLHFAPLRASHPAKARRDRVGLNQRFLNDNIPDRAESNQLRGATLIGFEETQQALRQPHQMAWETAADESDMAAGRRKFTCDVSRYFARGR